MSCILPVDSPCMGLGTLLYTLSHPLGATRKATMSNSTVKTARVVTHIMTVYDCVSGTREDINLSLTGYDAGTDECDYLAVGLNGRVGNSPAFGWFDAGSGSSVIRGREIVDVRQTGASVKCARVEGTDLYLAA